MNSKVVMKMSYEMEVVNIRLVNEPSWYSKEPLDNPDKIARFMSEELKSFDREVFCILNLTTDAKVINMNIVSMGTINASLVSAREVFKSSILSNAAAIIAVHLSPQWESVSITKRYVDNEQTDAGG